MKVKNILLNRFGKDGFWIIQLAAVAVFAGRAWQHLFFDAPFREFLWNQNFMEWTVSTVFSMSWDEYATHPLGDIWLQRIVTGSGIFYLICALIAAFIRKLPRWTSIILLFGAFNLVLLAGLYMVDKFHHVGQFFEYSLQFCTPVFLYILLKNRGGKSLDLWMKVALAMTFACHGLYAIGYYPRPVTFMNMTQNILGLNGISTHYFLVAAGWLDFVVAIGVFVPQKWVRPFLLYAVIWGFLTSVARVVGNFYWEYPLDSLHQWVYEVVYRFPHFLIPLYLLWKNESDGKHLR